MDRLVNRAIGVLIPPDAGKRKGRPPGWDGGLYSFMRRLRRPTSAASSTPRAGA
jgi:hypothetical protein